MPDRCFLVMPVKQNIKTLADLGVMSSTRPPSWDPIFSFLHTFLAKSAYVRGSHPPLNGSTPYLWEIMDPPLKNIDDNAAILIIRHKYIIM